MRLSPAAQIHDVATGNPDGVGRATSALRQDLELWIHHPPLLRTTDGFAQGDPIEHFRNATGWLFKVEIEGAPVGQVVGGAPTAVVNVVSLHPGAN